VVAFVGAALAGALCAVLEAAVSGLAVGFFAAPAAALGAGFDLAAGVLAAGFFVVAFLAVVLT
jgi:hypothetical protein